MGKNFKDTIVQFIKRTPLSHCLKRDNPSSPQINGDGVDEEMPMKENNKKAPKVTANNDQSRSTSLCPNSTMMTTTTFPNQIKATNIHEDDKTKIVVELNESNNKNGNDGFHQDAKANGVSIYWTNMT